MFETQTMETYIIQVQFGWRELTIISFLLALASVYVVGVCSSSSSPLQIVPYGLLRQRRRFVRLQLMVQGGSADRVKLTHHTASNPFSCIERRSGTLLLEGGWVASSGDHFTGIHSPGSLAWSAVGGNCVFVHL